MFKTIVLLALFLPFQFALNPAEGVDMAFVRVFILALFFVWLAAGLKNKKIIIQNNIQTSLVAVFLALNIFSIAVAKNTDWSWRKILFLCSIFPVYFIVSAVINSDEKREKILKSLVFGGTAAALLGLAQFLAQFVFGREAVYAFWANYVAPIFLGKNFSQAVLENPSWLVNIAGHTYLRAVSVFPDPHMLSFFSGMLIPFAAGFYFFKKRKSMAVCGIILLASNILSFSRGGYIGLLAGIGFLMVVFWDKIEEKYKIRAGIAAIILVVVVVLPNPIAQRFHSIFNLKEGSNLGRIEIWKEAVTVVWDNPWRGVGIGNYALAIKPSASYREPIYAHNAYLDIAAETGIPNAIVWLGIVVFAAIGFQRKSKQNKIFLAGTASMIIFSVHSMVELPIYSPTVLALFLIIIACSGLKTDDKKTV